MYLRPFKPVDLDVLHQIDTACFPAGIAYSRDELESFIRHRNSRTWVAQEGDEIAGFVVAQRISGEVLHIITIDVKEAWRRRGLGNTLMEAAEAWARAQKLRYASLETPAENRIAQVFYRRRGYQKLGRVDNYYGRGSAAWVMGKRLR
ncbi:MAG: GNAT family N-acetyltransferase [Terriglobia bacterium]